MTKWKLRFLLLLPLTVCLDSKVTLVKTVGKEPDVTPLCTNTTESIITMIVCKIRRNNSREECRLLYQHGRDFVHECDSRFTLKTQNQTVFLHLNGLTPVDSGIYTCECSQPDGTHILHLNVTVEDFIVAGGDEAFSSFKLRILIAANFVIIISGVILFLIHRTICHRTQPEPHHPNMEDIEPYSTFVRKEGGLYSTVRVRGRSHPLTSHLNTVLYLQKPQDIEPYSTVIQRENGRYSTTQIYNYVHYSTSMRQM